MIAAGLSISATNGYCSALKGVGAAAAPDSAKPRGTLNLIQAHIKCSPPVIPVRSTVRIAGSGAPDTAKPIGSPQKEVQAQKRCSPMPILELRSAMIAASTLAHAWAWASKE